MTAGYQKCCKWKRWGIGFQKHGIYVTLKMTYPYTWNVKPYGWCTAIWDDTTEDNTFVPSTTTAAAVSSQDVSMPRIINF